MPRTEMCHVASEAHEIAINNSLVAAFCVGAWRFVLIFLSTTFTVKP